MKQPLKWIAGILGTLTAVALGYYYLVLDWNVRPVCHKQISTALAIWVSDNGKDSTGATNAYPNVNGDSTASLAVIDHALNWGISWTNRYKYVPGLRETDPGDLILFYMSQPTRWTWHGAPPTKFKEKAWLIVPADFTLRERYGTKGEIVPTHEVGEMSERLSTEEFKARLQETLDFVRTNNRPNWQSVVAEHSNFLKGMK